MGTMELLLTMPITAWQAIVGKFLASWLFLGLALVLTFPVVITVNYLGNPDNGVIFCGYVGSLLMAGAYLAISCMTSAMTRNQVVSFIISVVVCLFFLLAGFPPVTNLSRAGRPTGWWRPCRFSVYSPLRRLPKGRARPATCSFSLRSSGFRCSRPGSSFAPARATEPFRDSDEKETTRNNSLFGRRRDGHVGDRVGGQLHRRRFKQRVDLTQEKVYTLSDGTRKILKGLDTGRDPLLLLAGRKEMDSGLKTYAQHVEDLLAEYKQAANSKIKIKKFESQAGFRRGGFRPPGWHRRPDAARPGIISTSAWRSVRSIRR